MGCIVRGHISDSWMRMCVIFLIHLNTYVMGSRHLPVVENVLQRANHRASLCTSPSSKMTEWAWFKVKYNTKMWQHVWLPTPFSHTPLCYITDITRRPVFSPIHFCWSFKALNHLVVLSVSRAVHQMFTATMLLKRSGFLLYMIMPFFKVDDLKKIKSSGFGPIVPLSNGRVPHPVT